MTILAVLVFGAGAILIASALDNSDIVTTFQKIMSGQTINWSGQTATPATQNQPGAPTPKNGQCPAGWFYLNGQCVDIAIQ